MICLMAFPVIGAAAENDTQYQLLKPGMGQAWLNSVGVDVQSTLNWIMGGLVVAFIATFIISLLIGGIKIFGTSDDMGSPERKSAGNNAILTIIGGMLLVVLAIKIGLIFFGWF